MVVMKVLLVNSADQWGGGETHVYDLAIGLKAKGIEVTVACRSESALHRRMQDIHMPCIVLPLLNSIDFYSVYKLAKFVSRQKIDIIHAHLARDYWLCIMATVCSLQVKVVLTRHVLFLLKNSIFHKNLLSRVSKIICVSQETKQVLMKHGSIAPAQLQVIPNAIKHIHVSHVEITKEALGIHKGNIGIGVFGSIEEIKGQQDFIEMAHLVHKEHPETKFYIVGSAKNINYVNNVKKSVEQYGLGKYVVFTDHRDDAVSVMRAMDIVVSTAKQDAFGLVILEAMSQGRPVVAYQTQGAKEIVGNGSEAVLVEVSNYHSLAENVLKLVLDDKLRRKLGESGQTLVKKQYNIEIMVDKTIELYDNVCRHHQEDKE